MISEEESQNCGVDADGDGSVDERWVWRRVERVKYGEGDYVI